MKTYESIASMTVVTSAVLPWRDIRSIEAATILEAVRLRGGRTLLGLWGTPDVPIATFTGTWAGFGHADTLVQLRKRAAVSLDCNQRQDERGEGLSCFHLEE